VPSSAEKPLDAVVRTIIALERSCLDADGAMLEGRGGDVEAAFRAQADLTAELSRLFAAHPETTPANEPKVALRLDGILAYREEQMRRLQAYRDEIASRLSTIGKVNAMSRSFGRHTESAHVLDGQY
jgi:hypothetical protein